MASQVPKLRRGPGDTVKLREHPKALDHQADR